jgi:multiple sugar transport system ATP-binding protein
MAANVGRRVDSPDPLGYDFAHSRGEPGGRAGTMAEVTIRALRKSYGAHPVVHGVDVDIPDGEFVVLVGPSGCGKSTLLRMIAGLESITAGSISIGPRVVNNLPPSERDIAMVFQNYALYPHKTVAANMGFALKMARMPKAEIDTRVTRAAEILGLTPYLARYPRELSGGQRQRVAMGRAIVRNPQVFLFDEPLSNLDAKLRVQMRSEIRELHQRLNTTTVYVTHDQIEAMTMADRIVVMRDGRIAQTGAPLDLYDHPANVFVAGFIGSPAMNLIEGAVQGGALDADSVTLQLPDGATVAEGQAVTFGIRPEHLEIDPAGFPATVAVVEPTGSETHVVLRLGPRDLVAVFRERLGVKPGDVLHLKPRPDRIHLFDTASGNRIP